MKQITFTQNFKEVKRADSPKLGQTRESIAVSFTDTAEYYTTVDPAKLTHILNDAITQYGKKLILENTDNWDYIPTAEQLTLDELYDDLTTSKARTRILTNKNIDSWSIEFASLATAAGKGQAYISTVIELTKERYVRLSSGEKNLQRLANVSEFILSISDDFRDELNQQVTSRLIDLITEILTADAEEISLDSLD